MTTGLDVMVVDDDADVCEVVAEILTRFYAWGKVLRFTDAEEAVAHCMAREVGVAVFVLDLYLGGQSGFDFLGRISGKFPAAPDDTVLITGNASDEVVNRCIAAGVTHLLEKPVRPYALQLAVRSIVGKYIRFARRLLEDPGFARNVSTFVS